MTKHTSKCSAWNYKLEAGNKLIVGVSISYIEPTTAPKVVCESDQLFRDHALPNFLVALNRERAKAISFLSNRK